MSGIPFQFLSADVFPLFVYAVIILETAAMDTPNKVAVLVTDAIVKFAPTMSSFKI